LATSGIGLSTSGSTKRTLAFTTKMSNSSSMYSGLQALAQRGVDALASATPVDSGLSAESWSYEIEIKGGHVFISWINTNLVDGTPVVVLLQYGHGTGNGGYVMGQDFINPAIQPIMEQIATELWKKVTSA
jgi:hypothetical protein